MAKCGVRLFTKLLHFARRERSITFAMPSTALTRFVDAVAYGKRNMPAWDDVLDPEQIEALWAYVIAGEAGE